MTAVFLIQNFTPVKFVITTSVRFLLFFSFIIFFGCKGQQALNSKVITKTIWVADHYGCQQGYIQACLLVKTNEAENYKDFNGTIEGFKYAAGNTYKLQVSESDPFNYTLIKVLETIPTKTKGIPLASQWVIVGFYDEQGNLQYDSLKTGNIVIAPDLKSFTGNAGCNPMRGAATVADENKIKLGPVENLRKKCPNIESENKMIEALESATAYKIDGAVLILFKNKTPLAQFESYRN